MKLISGNKKRSSEGGFTLIETTTALLVMMIGGLGIAAVFAFAIRNNTGSRDRAASLAVAQQQMERFRNMSFTDTGLAAATGTVTTSSAGRDYSVKTTITDTTSSLKTIKIEVTPLFNGQQWASGAVIVSVQRSTFALGPNAASN